MAGPFVVVIASIATAWLAIRSDDGLVTSDYYRKGLAINRTLKLSERASQLGLRASLRLTVDGIAVRLTAAAPGFVAPATLRVAVSHPTRAGLDQTQRLTLGEEGYRGVFRLPADGHWVVAIEDDAQTWRMLGNLVLPMTEATVFGASPPSQTSQ